MSDEEEKNTDSISNTEEKIEFVDKAVEVEEKTDDTANETSSGHLLKDRYEICFDKPLAEFNTNDALAYEARDIIKPQRNVFALVCGKESAPRLSLLPYLKSIDSPYILKLIEYGIFEHDKNEVMVLIYNKPTGPKASVFDESFSKMTNERFKTLSLSLLSACDTLKNLGITHRAIRLDNLYFKDSSQSELVLGDCLASFPSMHQPTAYETIECALCPPQSRGNGSISNDIYACGVALLGLILNKDFFNEMSGKEMAKQKLKHSSYAFLLNNAKINNSFATVIKSLLSDNPDNRIDHSRLYDFFNEKLSSFQTETFEKSVKALIVKNEKLYTTKAVALFMLENTDVGIEIIQNGQLLDWIKNGLKNEKLYNKIDKEISADKNSSDKLGLLYRLCVFLDSSLPVKNGNSYLFPESIAKTIFYNKKKSISLDSLHIVLNTNIIKLWYQEQAYTRAPANAGDFKTYVSRNDYGYGMERIMYDFDEDLPCISPLLKKHFVNNVSKVLKALEENKDNHQSLPMDKSIIAYMRCKMGKKIDQVVSEINANQDALKISALLRLYATIQKKSGPAQLPNLCKWLISFSKPLIQSFHNLKYQKYLEQEVLKISKNGKIIEIVEIIENEEARDKDREEYSETLKLANSLITEKNKILSGSSKVEEEARELALRFTSILAVLTMLSSFVFSIIYWMIK